MSKLTFSPLNGSVSPFALTCLAEIERAVSDQIPDEYVEVFQASLCRILASTGMDYRHIQAFNKACAVARRESQTIREQAESCPTTSPQ